MADEPTLDIDRHLRYWTMCLRSPLPHHYLSSDGNRMALAYFMINSVAILTPPGSGKPSPIPASDRRSLRRWVLSLQQPGGGFAGSPTLALPPGPDGVQAVDASVANLPATLFALQLLALLADDDDDDDDDNDGAAAAFDGVDRARTLRWLRRLQRPDGSFGEALKHLPGRGWFVGGGYDMRYCYIAAAVRWILRGDVQEGEPGWVDDFDTHALARYILSSQTYDGGFAGSSQEEPHAGYAYCAIGALALLDRPISGHPRPGGTLVASIRDRPGLIRWLASRQFVYLEPPEPQEDDDDDDDNDDEDNFRLPQRLSDLSLTENLRHVACNGRTNKVADTCYTWWVGGALANLGLGAELGGGVADGEAPGVLLDRAGARRFLLERMAHRIGGFSKHPGGPPDVYHACFGLAALAVLGEPGLSEFDSGLAVPARTVRVMERARAALVERDRARDRASEGDGTKRPAELAGEAVALGLAMAGKKPAWLSER
ncbi:hypothetical protein VTJ83DRAFT_3091 [Remersonia thermophila]|uniref:Prenyltransferase alpha-alpha toroid domain-containing protein n=1 Tax=Remersonia thermophila TaxID=72144 RepID=A0ABR4DDQ5_9PEZI